MQPAVGRVWLVRTPVNRSGDGERRGQREGVVRKDRQKQLVTRAPRERGRRGEASRVGWEWEEARRAAREGPSGLGREVQGPHEQKTSRVMGSGRVSGQAREGARPQLP